MAWNEYWRCVGSKVGENTDLIVWALGEVTDDVKEYVKEALQEFIDWFGALEAHVRQLVGYAFAGIAVALLKDAIVALAKQLPKMAAAVGRNPYFLAGLAAVIAGVGLGVFVRSAADCWHQWDVAAAA